MNNDMLVSVIVPAYNVEDYLEKCISSILQQTHASIEVIIVDDGATDNTGAIADKCGEKDERVKVIHKTNEGVSEARNTGLLYAKGKYVVFVDADDYLANDYIEYMMQLANISDADFCLSKNCFTRINEGQIENDRIEEYTPEDAVALLLSPRVIVGCWNKMFKKSFLDEHQLRFSSSLFYGEGLYFITQAAMLANHVNVGERKVYYYRRNNEMSATSKFNIEKMVNGEKALVEIKKQLDIPSKKIDDMWLLHMCIFCLGAVTKIIENGKRKEFQEKYKHWVSYMRKNVFQVIKSPYISLYRKTMIIGGCVSPNILAFLDLKRRKAISDNSVE
ncbi:glycosyltransferase family 2 protein [Sporofaciens sp. SGI.106]|uniref:glycosyltransferase family 2 protein n=1 Tax=Sporofaciens sp. SGI.106 TaxID=3420568 RepID=UPI003D07FEF7